jgi:putative FmdB family regulatory protein
MPIYEFTCKKCGKDSEVLVRSTDWKGTPCPACGSTQLMKKLSVFATSGHGDNSFADAPAPCGAEPGSCGNCHCGAGGFDD